MDELLRDGFRKFREKTRRTEAFGSHPARQRKFNQYFNESTDSD
jgi:hypothetical protein